MSEERVQIELTSSEALVLYEFLRHFDEEVEFKFRDQAEERALWTLEGQLEKKISILFSPDYRTLWNKACEQVRDKE